MYRTQAVMHAGLCKPFTCHNRLSVLHLSSPREATSPAMHQKVVTMLFKPRSQPDAEWRPPFKRPRIRQQDLNSGFRLRGLGTRDFWL